MNKTMQDEIQARLNDHNWSRVMACGVVSEKRSRNRRVITVSTLSSFSALVLVVVMYSFVFSPQTRYNRRGGFTTVTREQPRRVPAAASSRFSVMPVEFNGIHFEENRDIRLIDAALRSR